MLASGALPDYHDLHAPCLKRRPRATGPDARLFVAPAKDVKAGYLPKSIAIPATATELEAAKLCRGYWNDVLAWRTANEVKVEAYTVGWLIGRYLTDDFSTFRKNREKTRKGYEANCRIIKATKGRVPLEMITGPDLLRWHDEWGNPRPVIGPDGQAVKDAWGNAVTEPEHPQRRRHLVVMLRILAKHAVLINAAGGKNLRDLLSEIEFPVPKARMTAPTREQVEAIVFQAKKDGYRSVAITTLAQFELIERRIHIIGYWENKQWKPGWEWQAIDWRGPNATWVIRYFQTKNDLVLREFDLKTVPELLALLKSIPEAERWGPVIIAERQRKTFVRQPWDETRYAVTFRKIARRAGIPDTVWSMDMRAAGGTEADLLPEVTDRMLQDGFGHADPKTKDRYRRLKQRNAGELVKLRQAARKE